jgi:hypothetical protein
MDINTDGTYDKNKVIEGIAEIDDEIQKLCTQKVIDKSKLTRLRYEQMLRGLYLFGSPYN